jgi:hypothetical protein
MTTKELDLPPRVVSVPNLIGGVSICLLAAALGRTLDQRWQDVWAIAGACGLAAAVVLRFLENARIRRQVKARQTEVSRICELRLAQWNKHTANLASIQEAIGMLAESAAHERHQGNPVRPHDYQRLLSQFPLRVIPISEQDDLLSLGSSVEIAGRLRRISPTFVSFEHQELFDDRVVLLAFDLPQHRLCLVVDVKTTQTIGDRYASNGAVVAVELPTPLESELVA